MRWLSLQTLQASVRPLILSPSPVRCGAPLLVPALRCSPPYPCTQCCFLTFLFPPPLSHWAVPMPSGASLGEGADHFEGRLRNLSVFVVAWPDM
eukprot:365243-Chlamydomonas_euryale.AAC.9